MTNIFCKILGHKWDDEIKYTFIAVGEHLDNGGESIGAINKCTRFTCKRCGKEKSIRGWKNEN